MTSQSRREWEHSSSFPAALLPSLPPSLPSSLTLLHNRQAKLHPLCVPDARRDLRINLSFLRLFLFSDCARGRTFYFLLFGWLSCGVGAEGGREGGREGG